MSIHSRLFFLIVAQGRVRVKALSAEKKKKKVHILHLICAGRVIKYIATFEESERM